MQTIRNFPHLSDFGTSAKSVTQVAHNYEQAEWQIYRLFRMSHVRLSNIIYFHIYPSYIYHQAEVLWRWQNIKTYLWKWILYYYCIEMQWHETLLDWFFWNCAEVQYLSPHQRNIGVTGVTALQHIYKSNLVYSKCSGGLFHNISLHFGWSDKYGTSVKASVQHLVTPTKLWANVTSLHKTWNIPYIRLLHNKLRSNICHQPADFGRWQEVQYSLASGWWHHFYNTREAFNKKSGKQSKFMLNLQNFPK